MDILLIMFTLGYTFQFIAQTFILIHIKKTKSIDGLSLDTQVILLVANVVRIFWFMDTSLFEIPLVYLEITLSIGLQSYILYLFNLYKDSQYVQVKSYFNLITLIPTCLIIAFIINPGETYFTFEIFISFSFYLEAIGILPQIYLMRKLGAIDVKIGKYLLFLACSRFVRLIFWIVYWFDGEVFTSLLIADIIHSILLVDFVWIYFKNNSRGNMIII